MLVKSFATNPDFMDTGSCSDLLGSRIAAFLSYFRTFEQNFHGEKLSPAQQ